MESKKAMESASGRMDRQASMTWRARPLCLEKYTRIVSKAARLIGDKAISRIVEKAKQEGSNLARLRRAEKGGVNKEEYLKSRKRVL